jgi:putative tricarboxylic transport membrane protein
VPSGDQAGAVPLVAGSLLRLAVRPEAGLTMRTSVRRHLLRQHVRRLDHLDPAQHPGESSAVVTAIEGNLMAKRGRAAQALATAAIGSFVAGLHRRHLGAGASRIRGFASLAIGLMIGLVGIDLQTGQQRLTFGIPQLADGIDVVVVAVALFAIGETLWIAAHLRRRPVDVIPTGRPWMSRDDLSRSWKPWLRGTALGFPFGAIPAGGAEIPTFLSYVTEKRLTRHPEEFGKGAIEGVAGPEASNNASAAGSLVTMLALGLPTSATAAVMLAAFQGFGIQPGPLLLEREGDLVWGLIASLFIGNVLLLVLNLPLAPLWAKLLKTPRPYLYAGILFFASLGAYAVNAQVIDLIILLVIGLLGFMMRRYGLPVVPAIIGVILGPRAELQLRRALQISNGELSGLVDSLLAIIIYAVILLVLLWPLLNRFVLRRGRPATAGPAAAEVPAAAPPAGAEDRPRVPADGPPSGGAEAPGPGARPPDLDQEGP